MKKIFILFFVVFSLTANCFAGSKEDAQKMVETFLEKGSYVKVIYSEKSHEAFAGGIRYVQKSAIESFFIYDRGSQGLSIEFTTVVAHAGEGSILIENMTLDNQGNLIIKLDLKL